ncbi:MAG: aldo/keto reductase [Thermoguttaceae bacterium]
MTSRFILGTAQLGGHYGINNSHGMPTLSESDEMLDLAWLHGLQMLDTAESYGRSHEMIGSYIKRTGNRFRICTKFKSADNHTISLEKKIDVFLEELGVDSIECLFLHRFENLKENPRLLGELEAVQRDGRIRSIGVSLYETAELEYLLNGPFDIIDTFQIPVSVLNRTFPNHPSFHEALSREKHFFARSVFVQGILFAADDVAGKIHERMISINKIIQKQCNTMGIEVSRFAYLYVHGIPGIERIVIGCDGADQLLANIDMEQQADSILYREIAAFAEKELSNIPKEIYDPRFW